MKIISDNDNSIGYDRNNRNDDYQLLYNNEVFTGIIISFYSSYVAIYMGYGVCVFGTLEEALLHPLMIRHELFEKDLC